MTIRQFESRLKAVNPNLYIKRYGNGIAGIHVKGRMTRQHYVMRVPNGQITPYNQVVTRWGQADQFKTNFNIKGYYKLKTMTGRGRIEAARVLYTQRLIRYADIFQLSK